MNSSVKVILRSSLKTLFGNCRCTANNTTLTNVHFNSVRHYPAPPKRFYRKTGVLYSNNQYEVTLDQRKLKTPKGNPFVVNSEALALAVAAEWDAQHDKIQREFMHLSGLCSTVIDNPNNLTKYDLVQDIVKHLENDTVLYQSSEPDALYDLQVQEWQPVIEWFSERYQVDIKPSRDIQGPVIRDEDKAIITRHLMSYDIWSVFGFMFGVESIKSVILMLSCVDRHLSVAKAALLSRLEEEYQTGHWGRVEWAHDLNQQSTQARLAAAVLFVHLNSASSFIKTKKPLVT